MNDLLRIAVPTKGRLAQPSVDLLQRAGIRFERSDRALSVVARSAPVELLFVRADDVPELVADGVAALGITGFDLIEESGFPMEAVLGLGFGRCALTVAVPKDSPIQDPSELDGMRLATSHPRTVKRFFDEQGVRIDAVAMRGSVEVATKLDVADGIVDLVSTGSTMLVNGLRPIGRVIDSEAVLVAAAGTPLDDVAATVVTMLRSVVEARSRRYVLMNAPKTAVPRIEEIIPGIEAPSVVPLAHNGMVAIHSVVATDRLWTVLPLLSEAGATGILVLPIEQMIA
jgi:ATP phosphoribosyltransferase